MPEASFNNRVYDAPISIADVGFAQMAFGKQIDSIIRYIDIGLFGSQSHNVI